MKRATDFDLNRSNARHSASAGMAVINALQNFHPEDGFHPTNQLMGLAMAFVIFSQRFDGHPGTVLTRAERMLKDESLRHPEIRAVRSYLGEEAIDLL